MENAHICNTGVFRDFESSIAVEVIQNEYLFIGKYKELILNNC